MNPDDGIHELLKYEHHGTDVFVFGELQGLHKDHCLCYLCTKFHPCEPDNCPIAQATYEHNVKYHITTPMWECPEFEQASVSL